jgi:hypothetical protein
LHVEQKTPLGDYAKHIFDSLNGHLKDARSQTEPWKECVFAGDQREVSKISRFVLSELLANADSA